MTTNILNLSWQDVQDRIRRVMKKIAQRHPSDIRIYGIPRGGIFPAIMIAGIRNHIHTELVATPAAATVIIDDILDSGKTAETYREQYQCPVYVLVDKPKENLVGTWVTFPWEQMIQEDGPTDNVRRLIEYIGDDPNREGLKETPNRVIRSYAELFSGYKKDPKDVMKVFEDGACDELVLLKDIEFCSMCEHHMIPFTGKAHIAYIPNGKVIGLSKLARILEIFTRRLQIQERIGQQVTECLMEYLQPKGAACVIEAKHLCMTCRGVGKQHSVMVTSSLTGSFKEDPRSRNEFFSMIRG